MKKLLALLIVLAMVIGITPIVSADTTTAVGVNDVVLSPLSHYESAVDIVEPGFEIAKTFTAKTSTSTINLKYNFLAPAPCDISSGEYFYVTFYYMTNTDGTAPDSFQYYKVTDSNNTTRVNIDYAPTEGKWVQGSFVIAAGKDYARGDQVKVGFINYKSSGKVISIADPRIVYIGSSKDTTALGTTAITGITIGDAPVDLSANPESFTTSDIVEASDIKVNTTYGDADKVIVESLNYGREFLVKVYAPTEDYKKVGAVPSDTYTIVLPEPEEPEELVFTFEPEYKIHSENVVRADLIRSIAKNNVWTETLTGEDTVGTNFDTIYTYNVKEGTHTVTGDPGSSGSTNMWYFNSDLDDEPVLDDYVFVKFYIRALESYTNEAGETVNGTNVSMYPRLSNSVLKVSGSNAFKTTYEWKEYTWLVKVDETMANDGEWRFRLANVVAGTANKDDSGAVVSTTGTFENAQIQVAGVEVINLGKPIVTSGIPTEADVKAKANEVLSTCGLTGVYRSDVEDSLYDGSSSSVTLSVGPRYTANNDGFVLSGDTIFGNGTANVVKTGNTYKFASYAPNYNHLTGEGNKEEFTVTINCDYDFYDFAFAGNTFTLKADNGLETVKEGVLVGASYDANGKMLKMKAEPFSINGLGNLLSVTVPSAEGVASMKFFVWDGITTNVPYVKTIVISDITNGKITQ